ncbi:MAG: hypothetical protein IKE91_06585 [Clostridia bacterium]|nr:hypothetical protein [Clostridia bacterium]
MDKKAFKGKLIKFGFIISVVLFIVPSIVYFIRNGNLAYVDSNLEYKFLLDGNIDSSFHMWTYLAVIILMVIFYTLIIKKRRELFKSIKDVYKYIILISAICVISLPFMSSDVYYYLGIGRLASKYNQNPYYTDMKSYIDDNNININDDSVMETGYKNYWANTTVVYGALWSMICAAVAFFSFGSLNAGILIFKILNVLIHIFNCVLLYKLSKKKIFPLLYGLNPFVLIEGIVNVHNDIYMVFFILLALYMLREKKNIILSILFVAFATLIKYVAILLLPLIIIYYYKEETLGKRILKCVSWGILFILFIIIPYLLYIRDINVFYGLVVQQKRFAKGIYCYLMVRYPDKKVIVQYIRSIFAYLFVTTYTIICARLITNKDIKWRIEIRRIFIILLFFLMFMITNFQPWYFIWLSTVLIWQRADNIKIINQMQIALLIADSVFVRYSEHYMYVKQFFGTFVILTLVCMFGNVLVRLFKQRKINAKN